MGYKKGSLDNNGITKIKMATVAIGLLVEDKPVAIFGTGFLVDPRGYVVSAYHVKESCSKLRESYKQKGINAKIAIFREINSGDSNLTLKFTIMKDWGRLRMPVPHQYTIMPDIDITIGRPLEQANDFPYLEIKEPHKPEVLDEIAMCGYPAGEFSFDYSGEIAGVRFSPILQLGRIAGLMPFDSAPEPYAMQTDIVGTGGSSGSPLIDLGDTKVIGIAQMVLPSDVLLESIKIFDEPAMGVAKVGLTYGITNHILYPIVQGTREGKVDLQFNCTSITSKKITYLLDESTQS